jgi:hypothetical protein
MREEQLCEDQTGDGGIEEEIVPFDGGSDRLGDHGAAQLYLMLRRGQGR